MTADLHAEAEFLDVARTAFASSDGEEALRSLGWWELLAHLDDPELRPAIYAVFRAQGSELGSSAALGGLLAQPYLEHTDRVAGSVMSAIRRRSKTRGVVWVVVGDPADRELLIDRPGAGATIVAAADVSLRRIDVPGRLPLHEIDLPGDPRRRGEGTRTRGRLRGPTETVRPGDRRVPGGAAPARMGPDGLRCTRLDRAARPAPRRRPPGRIRRRREGTRRSKRSTRLRAFPSSAGRDRLHDRTRPSPSSQPSARARWTTRNRGLAQQRARAQFEDRRPPPGVSLSASSCRRMRPGAGLGFYNDVEVITSA